MLRFSLVLDCRQIWEKRCGFLGFPLELKAVFYVPVTLNWLCRGKKKAVVGTVREREREYEDVILIPGINPWPATVRRSLSFSFFVCKKRRGQIDWQGFSQLLGPLSHSFILLRMSGTIIACLSHLGNNPTPPNGRVFELGYRLSSSNRISEKKKYSFSLHEQP